VQNLSDLHPVGTFVQIHEMQDMGDKLRLVVMAHRRIKILHQIMEDISDLGEGKRKLCSLHLHVLSAL
jgi:ATP-dependent Lon protease